MSLRHRSIPCDPLLDFSRAHPDLLILVGTQTGNGELVANELAECFGEMGFTVHLVDCADAYPEMLLEFEQLVFVTCTWSDGTFPDNAVSFYQSLQEVEPDLAAVRFGIVGLGDRDYEPFYQTAALRMRGALVTCGAKEVQPLLEMEGVPGKEAFRTARGWALDVAERFADDQLS